MNGRDEIGELGLAVVRLLEPLIAAECAARVGRLELEGPDGGALGPVAAFLCALIESGAALARRRAAGLLAHEWPVFAVPDRTGAFEWPKTAVRWTPPPKREP